MRRQTSKEILAESFRELAQNKNADKITIKEITDNCGYSPATFYRNFKDKYDLIAWDYSRQMGEIASRISSGGYYWKQTLTDAILFIQDNREYLKNLLLHTNGHDSFIRHMGTIHSELLTKEVQRVCKRKELGEELDICIQIYCFGIIQLLCKWLIEDKDLSDFLSAVFEKALPEPLKEYLY